MASPRRLEAPTSGHRVRRSVRADTGVADQAEALLRGDGDLVIAALGRRVPVVVQLSVLAHAELDRLANLGRYCRRGSIRRAWGTEMAQLAGDLARYCRSPESLRRLQAEILVPLELDVLSQRRAFACREDLVAHVREAIPLAIER